MQRGTSVPSDLGAWSPQEKHFFKDELGKIRFMFGKMEYAPVVPVSAKDGTGVDKLLSTAITMYGQLNNQVETGRLNRALEQWLQEYPPPVGPQTRFKIKYAVQKSANPVKFIFFASRPKAVSEAYISYLRNRIRKDLGFSFIPVEVEIRASAKDKEQRAKSR
jgi:GTP-binding protein